MSPGRATRYCELPADTLCVGAGIPGVVVLFSYSAKGLRKTRERGGRKFIPEKNGGGVGAACLFFAVQFS